LSTGEHEGNEAEFKAPTEAQRMAELTGRDVNEFGPSGDERTNDPKEAEYVADKTDWNESRLLEDGKRVTALRQEADQIDPSSGSLWQRLKSSVSWDRDTRQLDAANMRSHADHIEEKELQMRNQLDELRESSSKEFREAGGDPEDKRIEGNRDSP
jgi:hypothetical protein